jgi:late competence protein required for DNA uptake (superfamily II DNA/RNA helicase)
MREIGYRIGQLARRLSEKLRGRQLLEAEAATLVPEDAGVPLHVLLQIASLMGKVRLVSGVAPDREADEPGWDKPADRMQARSADSVCLARVSRWMRRLSMPGRIRIPGWGRPNRRIAMRCRRCGSREARGEQSASGGNGSIGGNGIRRTPCASCGRMQCAYCEMCLTMGRSRECGLLVVGEPTVSRLHFPHPASRYLDGWGLSAPQREAAGAALSYLMSGGQGKQRRGAFRLRSMPFGRRVMHERTFLLWAVTGAGKTEMLFPLLQAVLSAGGRAAVAAPRRDVVLELAPRLAKAFPQASLAVLYGGSPHRFETGGLTLATTHQLIRFREAFDLVVIDEVDAFPYHNDPMLQFAGANARAARGIMVLLSATPPAAMQREVRRRRLPSARVSVRYHGRPLPIPARLNVPSISRWAHRSAIPAQLEGAIRRSAGRGAQIFMFVPYIRQVEPLVQCLRRNAGKLGLDPEAISGTSSQDPERSGKVIAFRGRDIRLLVTTTILERGVTIPKSDVFVLDADKPLFDAASLVQMAGRAGRSADDPDGLVYFAAPAWTASQREACRQIREMNHEAKKKGYLAK